MVASKEQERKALEQIKKIIESVGGYNSYIGTAFEGCCSVAADNIENDFGNSYKASLDTVRANLEEEKEKRYEAYEKYAEVKKELDTANGVIATQKNQIEELEKQVVSLGDNEAELEASLMDADQEMANMEREIEALQEEIIRLKAKLYDLMTA